MTNLETWINDMSTRPLPGGVAAAAVAAAMGAALIAKALRISLDRESYGAGERETLAAVLDLGREQQAALLRLAADDVQAYRAVIATRSLPAADPARVQAWRTATEVPMALAEACHRLLERLAAVVCQCWPGVCIDYQIGGELLRAGARAGLLAAEDNLDNWDTSPRTGPLRARVNALREAERRLAAEDD